MKEIELQYHLLLAEILDFGIRKKTRNGETLSVFGRQIRHKMSDGFPMITTKKMYFKGIVTELLWFLQGRTDLKYLIDNDCNIWTGDAYANFCKSHTIPPSNPGGPLLSDNLPSNRPIQSSKEEFINKIKTDDEFAKRFGDLGKIYGFQWRNWGGTKTDGFHEYESNGYNENIKGIDQIQKLINDLKSNPDSRRLMLNSWNVEQLPEMVLPPCHYGFQIYTRELSVQERWASCKNEIDVDDPNLHQKLDNLNIPKRAISLMWNQRSCDFALGIPFNIASYALLLEIIAKSVNMIPEDLIGNLGDCHIYINQIDGVREQLTRQPYPLPKLRHMKSDEFYKSLSEDLSLFTHLDTDDFVIENYQSHPAIKIPLSN